MRKIVTGVLAMGMMLACASMSVCAEADDLKVGLCCGTSSIDDKSFIQSAWILHAGFSFFKSGEPLACGSPFFL